MKVNNLLKQFRARNNLKFAANSNDVTVTH